MHGLLAFPLGCRDPQSQTFLCCVLVTRFVELTARPIHGPRQLVHVCAGLRSSAAGRGRRRARDGPREGGLAPAAVEVCVESGCSRVLVATGLPTSFDPSFEKRWIDQPEVGVIIWRVENSPDGATDDKFTVSVDPLLSPHPFPC